VLVIGPTVTGSMQAAGHRGTVISWIAAGAVVEPGWRSAGDGWQVELDRVPDWLGNGRGTVSRATFPASSLMPLDGQAEPEAVTTAEPAHQEVSHAA
jgi:hypothetical protein